MFLMQEEFPFCSDPPNEAVVAFLARYLQMLQEELGWSMGECGLNVLTDMASLKPSQEPST